MLQSNITHASVLLLLQCTILYIVVLKILYSIYRVQTALRLYYRLRTGGDSIHMTYKMSGFSYSALACGQSVPVCRWLLFFSLLALPIIPPAAYSTPAQGQENEYQHGDQKEIQNPGQLRVLYSKNPLRGRNISPTEQLMLERYAQEQQLELQWIESASDWNLLPMLADNKGDVIVGQHKSLLSGMNGQALFTLPWTTSLQQVVARTDTTQVNDIIDLAHRQVALKKSSPAWPVMQNLLQDHQTMDLVVIPESLSPEEVMQRVSNGQYDVTVADSDFLKQYLPNHPELSVVYNLDSSQARVWIVRKDAGQLQSSLNQFLNRNHLEFGRPARDQGAWPAATHHVQ